MATSRFLSNSDQSLNTTDSPTFAQVNLPAAGKINLPGEDTAYLQLNANGQVSLVGEGPTSIEVGPHNIILNASGDFDLNVVNTLGIKVEGQMTIWTVKDATQTLRGRFNEDVFSWDGAMKLTPRAFAALPAAPEEGMLAWVNDSSTATWGATIAGGGANKVLAVYNSANWTVVGK